jgi:murein DD-endopeptidase MepM/ murein hydrolase activator NlpD
VSGVLALGVAGCAGGDLPRIERMIPTAIPAGEEPALAKREPAPEPPPKPRWAPRAPTWTFPLPVDHGLRTDDGGQGQFLAPRAHGKHNGIDLLAPVGTSVLAACSGKARSDQRGGYGRVVQLVCPVPTDLSGGDMDLHVSLFYAHLDKTSVPKTWKSVKAGQPLGTVGKTGNAAGPKIKPHLHLEMIVRSTEDAALAETHSGADAEAGKAADAFFASLHEECMEPAHLTARAEVRRERRVDPFVMLVCASRPKPAFTVPEAKPLREAAMKWSKFYASAAFDVDEGPRPLAKRDD